VILLWLGITALMHASVTLFASELFAGSAWAQLLIVALVAAVLIKLTQRLRSVPGFGIHGQWLILAALLTLLLTEGGLPGHAGSIAVAVGIDVATRQFLFHIAQGLLVVGLWQALSNLARSREQAVRALEAELHNAMTEMVIDTAPRPKPQTGPRLTQTGLTVGLTQALEAVGPAHRMLRDLVLREPNNIAARLALHNRLRNDETQAAALSLHAAYFIVALRKADRIDLALLIAEECARLDSAYYPDIDNALELSRRAIIASKYATALRLLRHFDVRYPAHPDIPKAFFMSAQALGGLGKIAPAQALLGALVNHFPEDPLAADAIALSARLATRR
jgi:TolA-binding protein